MISDREDAEAAMVERLDSSDYRDDILRLLFICCHPDLPATQQIAAGAAHRLRPVGAGDRPRLPRQRSAMEQRITRAKAR